MISSAKICICSSISVAANPPSSNQPITALSHRLLKVACGANDAVSDAELISWLRGDNARSATLRNLGLFEPARDDNAFRRLKTAIAFLRNRMGYQGLLIAFDEGYRTSSFRRGSVKQKQAVENLLTMINQNAEGEFGGVIFLYAATPDFRSDVISNYRALSDRIGTKAFSKGSPMVPFINLEETNSDEVIYNIGEKLLGVFEQARDVTWDKPVQIENMRVIVAAQKDFQFETPKPRFFVYQYCRFLDLQRDNQRAITAEEAADFVADNEPPVNGDSA